MLEEIINKFIAGERLTSDEIVLLDKLLNDPKNKIEIYSWLEQNWKHRQNESVSLQFEQLREKISISSFKMRVNRLFIVLSKAAAVLFIPLFAATLYLYVNQNTSSDLFTLTTQKGEQTSVILPDGSKVWLNVDTKLSYPADYGEKSRNLELEGEAYFEVEKNKELPFIVSAGKVVTTALGTRFIVSAYHESSEIRSSLVEGSVNVEYGQESKLLKPGQQLLYHRNSSKALIKTFEEKLELAWMNDELIFRLMPFNDVVKELEKWFDIKIEYNADQFKTETLTVRFEEYESLETILKVIAKANGFKYVIEDNVVKIKK
ncbi:FecR domain-containing protein [uncultured Draconibacterium sp.]|uniref:FecR family protein n=1 Tax=uncultured Draconibacterium sp. TaxID=1573823 RepID=UPI00321628D0